MYSKAEIAFMVMVVANFYVFFGFINGLRGSISDLRRKTRDLEKRLQRHERRLAPPVND